MDFVTFGATMLPWRRSHLSFYFISRFADRLGKRRPSGAACARQQQTSFAPKKGWGMLVYAPGWSLASQFRSYTPPQKKL